MDRPRFGNRGRDVALADGPGAIASESGLVGGGVGGERIGRALVGKAPFGPFVVHGEGRVAADRTVRGEIANRVRAVDGDAAFLVDLGFAGQSRTGEPECRCGKGEGRKCAAVHGRSSFFNNSAPKMAANATERRRLIHISQCREIPSSPSRPLALGRVPLIRPV